MFLPATKIKNAAVNNYAQALEFVPDSSKTRRICNKAVETYPSVMQYILECYKTQEICDTAVDTCSFVFDYVLLFLIDIRLKKFVVKLFPKNLLC